MAPNEFDWRDVVRGDVDRLPTSAARDDERSVQTSLRLPVFRLLLQASRQRRVSPAAYARRAIMAMVCRDLGIRLSVALREDPRMARETGYPIRDDDGTAFGPWEILALVPQEGADVKEMP